MCIVCGAGFFQKIDLKLHSITHASNNKLHECSICKKVFKQAAHLKYHLHTHLKQNDSESLINESQLKQESHSSDLNDKNSSGAEVKEEKIECKQEQSNDHNLSYAEEEDDDDGDDDEEEEAEEDEEEYEDNESIDIDDNSEVSLNLLNLFLNLSS